MNDEPPDGDDAARWLREASEELRAAEVLAGHADVPNRAAGFHAHLAAEKALKSLLIVRGIEVPRVHDLVGLQRLLSEVDQRRFGPEDLEVPNPWTVEGRYPADVPDADDTALAETLAAARRVVDTVSGDSA